MCNAIVTEIKCFSTSSLFRQIYELSSAEWSFFQEQQDIEQVGLRLNVV